MFASCCVIIFGRSFLKKLSTISCSEFFLFESIDLEFLASIRFAWFFLAYLHPNFAVTVTLRKWVVNVDEFHVFTELPPKFLLGNKSKICELPAPNWKRQPSRGNFPRPSQRGSKEDQHFPRSCIGSGRRIRAFPYTLALELNFPWDLKKLRTLLPLQITFRLRLEYIM